MKRKIGRRKRLAFVRGPGTFKGGSRLLLFINGEHISAPATNVKLLAHLYKHRGQVVPLHSLCRLLGFPLVTEVERHILRQYTSWISQRLSEHRLPYCVTVARNVGYALGGTVPQQRRK
jgi:DNA-binding response OmpR family regulator